MNRKICRNRLLFTPKSSITLQQATEGQTTQPRDEKVRFRPVF